MERSEGNRLGMERVTTLARQVGPIHESGHVVIAHLGNSSFAMRVHRRLPNMLNRLKPVPANGSTNGTPPGAATGATIFTSSAPPDIIVSMVTCSSPSSAVGRAKFSKAAVTSACFSSIFSSSVFTTMTGTTTVVAEPVVIQVCLMKE